MNAQLTEHQKVLLQLLSELDRICGKHEIKFVLFAGSALGAVRHQGIIPWDDDIDVAMLRSDYEKLLQVAAQELDQSLYYLQAEYSAHWPMFFSKIRRNGTACIERFIPKDEKMHQGIYIDIFPVDNLSDNRLMQKLQFAASKVVIAKSLDRRGYLTDSRKKKLFMLLCKLLPLKLMHRIAIKRKKTGSKYVHSFFAAASSFDKNVFCREDFEQTKRCEFSGLRAPISANCEQMLERIYGDYNSEPSEQDKSEKIHGVIVDTEHSYEMYLQEQRKMKVTEFARSIR